MPRVRLPALFALLAAGCGTPTAAPAPSTALELTPSVSILAAPGELAPVSATLDGAPAGPLTYVLEDEDSRVPGWGVLDRDALARGEVRAAAPGTARVRVRAGSASATLEVRVAPTRPVVVAAELRRGGEVDTLLLRGWDLRGVGAVRVGAAEARVLSREETTVIAVVASPDARCAAADTLRVPGAHLVADAVLPGGGAPLRLAPGQTLRLPDGEGCLRLPDEAEARYALVFADLRAVERAERGYEGPTPSAFSVTVAGGGRAAPAVSPAPSIAPVPAHPRVASLVGNGVFRRGAPWSRDDRLSVPSPDGTALLGARVARVYGGWLVLAVADGALPAGTETAWVARADSAFAFLAERGEPLLRAALDDTRPVTSAGSGQLLVVAHRDPHGYLGVAAAETVDGARRALLYLHVSPQAGATSILRVLAHEAAHAWQEAYAWSTRPADSPYGLSAPAWSAEGGADLLAAVVVSRFLGVPLLANWPWAAAMERPSDLPLALLPATARGDLAGGYAAGAGFLLDQTERLVRGGVAMESALAAVSRGAVDGWHGWDARGVRRAGLATRLRAHRPGWTAGDALLTWAASQAVDDLTPSPELQNHTFHAVGTAGAAHGWGWQPAAELHATASASAVARGGGAGYLRISGGGTFRVAASVPETGWLLVRYR